MKRIYVYSINEQFIIHAGTYCTWVMTMAYLRKLGQSDGLSYLTEAVIETLTLDKGYCRGNLYASVWFIILLVFNVLHLVHLYWTFVLKKQIVPDVRKFTSLPPKINWVK